MSWPVVDKVILAEALTSLAATIAFDVRDWSLSSRDAWIYGIAVGWDDDALAELTVKHEWPPGEVARLRRYREVVEKCTPEAKRRKQRRALTKDRNDKP